MQKPAGINFGFSKITECFVLEGTPSLEYWVQLPERTDYSPSVEAENRFSKTNVGAEQVKISVILAITFLTLHFP